MSFLTAVEAEATTVEQDVVAGLKTAVSYVDNVVVTELDPHLSLPSCKLSAHTWHHVAEPTSRPAYARSNRHSPYLCVSRTASGFVNYAHLARPSSAQTAIPSLRHDCPKDGHDE
jgi:hypothetical protein